MNSSSIRHFVDAVEESGKLLSWLNNADEENLFRINLKKLRKEIDLPLSVLTSAFLKLVHAGVFNLTWEYHCPHCNAIPDFKHNFSESTASGFCPLCDVSFRNTLDTNVEVTFTIHPSILPLSSHMEENFKATMYGAAKEQKWSLPDEFFSGLECTNNAVFQELFGDQVLSYEESLQIQNITLLFTDIKGSTAMYSEMGDAPSYNIVREHFKILFNEIENNNGFVVKTIGDAVMASFMNPQNAMTAALNSQKKFFSHQFEPVERVSVKMGLHAGPVIMVTMNARNDYFGNSVNLAARIQSEAAGDSIWFSEKIFADAEARKVLNRNRDLFGAKVKRKETELKGIPGTTTLYSIHLQ